MRPLLRWAGSKMSTLPALCAHMPEAYDCYVEPFCGSAALFFHLEPPKAILADVNIELVNFYKMFSTESSSIQAFADALPRDRTTYYKLRDHLRVSQCLKERAVIFFYLNRNCFNGLYRTDRSGNFNVPFAGSRTGQLPNQAHSAKASKLLSKSEVLQADFEDIVRANSQPGKLIFLDPPYAVVRRHPFTDYSAQGFGQADLIRLLGCLEEADDGGAKFVMTYDAVLATSLARRPHWRQTVLRVRRNISGFAGARRMAEEVVMVN